MRFIDIDAIIDSSDDAILDALEFQNVSVTTKTDVQKQITVNGGNTHWRPMKVELERLTGKKCWYTESKNPGCLNDLEHFRPKGRVIDKHGNVGHWYWFLAFNPINYRLSAQITNRLNENVVLGETGGKGDKFPLLPGSIRASNLAQVDDEFPVLLDPCCERDSSLLQLNPDGRPIVSQVFEHDEIAADRVRQSNLILNLDYASFNEDREALYNHIKNLIEERGDQLFSSGNHALEHTQEDLRRLMCPKAA